MSELDDLPSWADRNKTQQDQPKILGEQPAMPPAVPPAQEAVPQPPPEPAPPAQAPGQTVRQDSVPERPIVQQPIPDNTATEQPRETARATSRKTTRASAERVAELPDYQAPPRRRRGLVAGLILLGILALAGLGTLGYFLAQSQGDSNETVTGSEEEDLAAPEVAEDDDEGVTSEDATAATEPEPETIESTDDDAAMAEEEDPNVTIDVTENDADSDADAGQAEGTEEDAMEETDEAEPADDAATGPDESGRQAVLRGGKVYLSGKVPSEEVGELIVAKAAAVLGPDNVVNEYEIDPTAEIKPGESAPLYVEDVVLFQFNGIDVDPAFLPILDLGTLLLRQNPQATVTVVSRTDAVGSEAVNLDVATKRAQAVINYWLGQGVNPDQLIADPRGEEGASDSDDDETSARNRRAEFIITGLLD